MEDAVNRYNEYAGDNTAWWDYRGMGLLALAPRAATLKDAALFVFDAPYRFARTPNDKLQSKTEQLLIGGTDIARVTTTLGILSGHRLI